MTPPSEKLYPEESIQQCESGAVAQESKICNKCGFRQPLDNFHKTKSVRCGHVGQCKSCMSKTARKRKEQNIERMHNVDPLISKICSDLECPFKGAPQPIENFGRTTTNRDGYCGRCRRCARISDMAWRKNNPESHLASRRRTYQKNAAAAKLRTKQWRKDNPERHREYSRRESRKHWARRRLAECQRRAKDKGVCFDMRQSDLFDHRTGKLPEFCPIFPHIRLDYEAGPDRRAWASVDRMVPQLGYTQGNICVVSMAANTWKNNGSNPAERARIVKIMRGNAKSSSNDYQMGLLFD